MYTSPLICGRNTLCITTTLRIGYVVHRLVTQGSSNYGKAPIQAAIVTPKTNNNDSPVWWATVSDTHSQHTDSFSNGENYWMGDPIASSPSYLDSDTPVLPTPFAG